jgi:DNA-binding transcriptional LysR family regulator
MSLPSSAFDAGYRYKEITENMEVIRNYTRSSGGEIAGSLRIGVPLNFARYRLAGILQSYMAKYPRVDVGVTTGHSTRLFHELSLGSLSIAIVRGNFHWPEGDILLSTEPMPCGQQGKSGEIAG